MSVKTDWLKKYNLRIGINFMFLKFRTQNNRIDYDKWIFTGKHSLESENGYAGYSNRNLSIFYLLPTVILLRKSYIKLILRRLNKRN